MPEEHNHEHVANDNKVTEPEHVAEHTTGQGPVPEQAPAAEPIRSVLPQPLTNQPTTNPSYQNYNYQQPTENYRGLKGWLAFFMVMFIINGISSLFIFLSSFVTVMEGDAEAATIIMTIFSIVLGPLMLTTGVMIALRKKIGKNLALASILVSAIYMVTLASYAMFSSLGYTGSYGYYRDSAATIVVTYVGAIIISLIIYALLALYFVKSRRVRDTLIES